MPAVAPVTGLGVTTIDFDGSISGPITTVVAGSPTVYNISGKLTVNPDCTVSLKVSCAEGCTWEAVGHITRSSKEISLIFTKTNGYPLTATATLRPLPN
jgi:hypothetical protein